jgi:hypothetical protein
MIHLRKFNEGFSMSRDKCDRCGEKPVGGTTMSIFNQDVICMMCKEEEKKDPEYGAASLSEMEAIRRGETNYEGAIPDYKPLKR